MRTALEYDATSEQYLAALKLNQRRLLRRPPIRRIVLATTLLSAAAWFVIALVAMSVVHASRSEAGPWLFPAFFVGLAITGFQQWLLQRAIFRHIAGPAGATRGRCTLCIEAGGLHFSTANGEGLVAWSGIDAVEDAQALALVCLDNSSFILIPDAAFCGPEERAEFLAEIRTRIDDPTRQAAAIGEGAAAASPSVAANSPNPGGWVNLVSNLKLGLRLASFLRPQADGLRVSWSQFVMLAALGIAVPFAVEFASIGPKGSFSFHALPGALFHLPLMIFAAWAVALLAGRAQRTLELLITIAAMAIPIDVAYLAFGHEMERLPRAWSFVAYYVPYFWLALAAAVAAIRLFGIGRQRWLATALVTGLVIALPLSTIDPDGTLWAEPYDEEAAAAYERKRMALANEDTFYLQPRLLERELAALKPGRKGVIDLYFIGAAGYSEQDVFMKEVHSVADLFRERFGTEGHSVMLINNAKTVAESPIASATSLDLALRRVGEVMDRDEDVLFLFLTSHGSKDHKFSLDFWPMRFNTLDPKRLRQMLDASGIKRRVIVVSACYSGGFIDALKDDNSLVIAAAAPDRNSFGCSNEADYTYFGKAYFDEALRKTSSFTEAFDIAKASIAAREQKEDRAASDPRIYVGDAIRQPLEELVRLRTASLESPRLQ